MLRLLSKADNRDRDNLPGATYDEGGLSRVHSGGRGGVAIDSPPDPAQIRPGGLMGGNPPCAPPGRPKLTGSLSLNVCCGSGARWRVVWRGL